MCEDLIKSPPVCSWEEYLIAEMCKVQYNSASCEDISLLRVIKTSDTLTVKLAFVFGLHPFFVAPRNTRLIVARLHKVCFQCFTHVIL